MEKIFKITLIAMAIIVAIVVFFTNFEEQLNQNIVAENEIENNIEKDKQNVVEKDETTEPEQPKELTEAEYKANCKEYSYKDVLRNPENYMEESVHLCFLVWINISRIVLHGQDLRVDCLYFVLHRRVRIQMNF